jgi:ribosomal protein S18 acetylase RimI-like enzyme
MGAMTNIRFLSALDYSLPDIAALVTRGFEGYFVPIQMDVDHLLAMVRRDSVALSDSRVIQADGAPAGVALMARRGWASRVAAMGIVAEWRGKGLGKQLMLQLLDDARQRGDREMLLEVIEENDPAIRLYESVGFGKTRRLVGLSKDQGDVPQADGLEEIDIRELGRLISAYGLKDVPWQLSAETIAQYAAPSRAYALDGAYALISDPGVEDVRFYSLLVEPRVRRQGRATAIVKALVACHGARAWHVPAIFPEEIVGPFHAAGFHRDVLSQWQMRTIKFER